MNLTPYLLALVLAGAGLGTLQAQDTKMNPSKLPPASTKKNVTYAQDIKPILEQSCVKCHGAEKPKAKLRLDTLEGALKGGDGGKSIKPGKSGESPLVYSIAGLGDPDYHMPPPNNKAGIAPLTKEQVGWVRAWIDQGAK